MHVRVYGVISTHMGRADSRLPLMWQSSGLLQEGHLTYTQVTSPVDWLAGCGECMKVTPSHMDRANEHFTYPQRVNSSINAQLDQLV